MRESTPYALPIHLEESGDGGDPIVLLHGFGACGFTWRYWAPGLAERHRVFVVEWKRFEPGEEPTPGYHTPDGQAELIYSLIMQKDLRRVTLIGHSLGGGIALLAALKLLDRAEGRLQALVLVSGAAYPQQIPPFISVARIPLLGVIALRLLPPRWTVRLILRVICHDRRSISESQVEAYSEVLRSRAGRYGLVKLAREILPADIDTLTKRFSEIEVPVLLLWGAHDPVVPLEIGERLKRDLPNAELVVLERCSHMAPEEHPHDSLEIVRRFLARSGSGAQAGDAGRASTGRADVSRGEKEGRPESDARPGAEPAPERAGAHPGEEPGTAGARPPGPADDA